MAEIYQPQGEQVALTGPGRTVGFDPGQAYDPSRQMMAAIDQQSARQQKDIEALSSFSNTLNKFLVDKAEARNKELQARGYAKFIRGEITLDPKQQQAFQVKTALLQSAADRDTAVAQDVKNSGASPGTASTIISTSPAIKGWEAVGAAVAAAQLAPSNLESFLSAQKNRTQPVTLEDGTTVIPADAKGYQIADVTRALTKEWVLEYGLDRLNPQIIQEYAGYNLSMAERQVLSNWMKEADERELKTLQYDAQLKAANTLPSAITREEAAKWQTTTWTDLNRAYRDPVEANEIMLKLIENQLNNFKGSNNIPAMKSLVDSLYEAPLSGTNMTFGQKNSAKFQEFVVLVSDARKDAVRVAEEDEKQRYKSLLDNFQQSRRTDPPQELDKKRKILRDTLIAAGTPAALAVLNDLDKQDSSLALTSNIEKQILAGNKNPTGGMLWKRSSIDQLVLSQDLEAEDGERLKALLPEVMSGKELFDDVMPGSIALATDTIVTGLKKNGEYERNGIFKARIDAAMKENAKVAADTLFAKYQANFEKTGVWPRPDVVSRDHRTELLRISKNPAEEFYIDDKGELPNRGKPSPTKAPPRKPSTVNISPEELNRLRSQSGPYPTTSLNSRPAIDLEDFKLYQDLITQGGNLPPEAKALIKMSGTNEDAWMAWNAKQLGEQYVPNPDKEASYRRNAAINVTAANTLRNPRATKLQIKNALDILRNGGTRVAPVDVGKFGAGDYGGLLETTSSGEGGYNSINYGTTESASTMNLTETPIGQILKLQESGKLGAAGIAQWTKPPMAKVSNLRIAMNAAGLEPQYKMNEANQRKMFWAYILNTDVRPDLRDYLLGKHNDLNRAQDAFAFEWAAAPGSNGRGKYDNDPFGNRATIPATAMRKALLNARKEIMQLLQSGRSITDLF